MQRIIFIFLTAILMRFAVLSPALADEVCVPTGQWLEPQTKQTPAYDDMILRMSKRPVVLLGETHNNKEHHNWQLHTIAALYALNPNMVLAFEMFPRRFQPSLDKWIRGDLDQKAFLDEVDWAKTWSFDAGLYMPVFDFARMHRVPMVAMNIDRKLIGRISKEGWKAIPKNEREGVGDPAPASNDYIDFLSTVFGQHSIGGNNKKPEKGKIKAPPVKKLRDNPMFRRFIESQITWDRAMAEKIADTRTKGGKPLVVGIVGQGHIQYGFGIPYQLADLGIDDAAILIPWNDNQPCSDLNPVGKHRLADAVFGVHYSGVAQKPNKPKLGIYIEDVNDGIHIYKVVDKSLAEISGLLKDDIIIEAAGRAVAKTTELIKIVSRQAPGTWLPLKIKRGAKIIEIIAKFPSLP